MSDPNATVVRYYVVPANQISTSHLFFDTTPAGALKLVESLALIFDFDVVAEELGFHCDPPTQERITELGFGVGSDLWELRVDYSKYPWSNMLRIWSGDRAALMKIAQSVTAHNDAVTAHIDRFARIRFIYENGGLTSDFADLPYLNVTEADWV